MELSAGASMWLPCEVSPGPFSDERTVLVIGDDGEWGGLRQHPVAEEEDPEG